MAAHKDIHRRRAATIALVAGIALVVPLIALASREGSRATAAAAATPNFKREVAPILRAKCASCHRIGGIAPFAFRTEADVAARASLLVDAVGAGRMPPWPPGPTSPRYVGQGLRTLTTGERSTLVRWAKSQLVRPGAPRSRTPVGKPPQAAAAARPGETALDLRMPTPYTPKAGGGSTDDYRCFLLDPKLTSDASVTSARIEPGVTSLVHHVILYRILPASVADAERLDAASAGQGWTCFGGSGVRQPLATGSGVGSFLNDAGWISAWAPGRGDDRQPPGIGVELPAGSKVVMQVHYNLLNGRRPDRSRAVLTTVPGSAGLDPVYTMLLPAPVELACAKGVDAPLCDRTAAQFDQVRKYGQEAALIPSGLLVLCQKDAARPTASPVATCDRTFSAPTTVRAVAGHMHMLGTAIRVELNPRTPRAKVLLEIPRWSFHWQGSYVLEQAVSAQAGDVVRVTCRHDISLRSQIRPRPAPRYIMWGEGTTDEMCLGILQTTRG